MQYRIKKVIDGYDFSVTYYPQYKFLGLFWCNFEYFPGFDSIYYGFDTIEEAEEFIKKERNQKNCSSTSYTYL